MDMSDYQRAAQATSGRGMLTPIADHAQYRLLIACLGLAGEAGELIDHVKKHVGHGHPLDVAKVAEESTDCMWYLAEILSSLDLDMSAAAELNIAKLKKRYPQGFSKEASMNRPTEAA